MDLDMIGDRTIGRGGTGGGGHSLREWWLNDGGDLAIKQAVLVLLAEAGMVGVAGTGP